MAANDPNDQYNTGQTTPKDPNQVPPPGVNPDVVYTDQQGKGYNAAALNSAWGGGAFRNDPANSRVGDLLQQYGYGGGQTQPSTPPPPPTGLSGLTGAGAAVGGTIGAHDPRSDQLYSLLMSRAQQGLNVSPDDPTIKGQTDAYSANNERAQRSYLSQAAEQGGPNANLEGVARSMAEQGAQATGGLQASLMQNELNSRRTEIQQALMESGSLLTSQQQLQLQQELGLLDAQLKQQGITSNNDQFMADLGFRAQDRGNYWDALRSNLIKG